MLFAVVLSIYSSMHKKSRGEESSIQYSRRVDAAVCVRALQLCEWESSHTAHDCYSNNPECLLCSPCAFGQSLYRVSRHVRMNENASIGDNADGHYVKMWTVPKSRCLFILQKSIFYSWHRCIVSSYIVSIYRSRSMNRYTPNESPGFFVSGLQLICIFWSLVSHFPLDNT